MIRRPKRGLWQTFERKSQVRKRSDIYRKRERRTVCLGIHPGRCCKIVCIYKYDPRPSSHLLSSGLHLKEQGRLYYP